MAKLTLEDKKEIIRLYKEQGYGVSYIARQFRINQKVIVLLIRRFNFHGERIFDKSYSVVTPDIKLEIIQKLNIGYSINQLMVEYTVTDTQIHKWVSQFEELGYDGLKNKKKGRPPSMKKELKQIDPNDKDALLKAKDERIRELECEVEALKKLRALVQQRNSQPIKKKQ